MSDITKRLFVELALDGNNYLTWALDAEIHLASDNLSLSIVPDSDCSAAQKAKALIFIRHHLNQDLKNEYITERDPLVLWQSLKDRFQQQIDIILPQAQYDWVSLRFQDFKSVTEYNSSLHRIVSLFKLCKQEITDAQLIERTLSTFHASNIILQQQYRAKNYATHSELTTALLVSEKHNQLFMRNYNTRPVGSQTVPEAHATINRNENTRGRGYSGGRGHGRGGGRGQGNSYRFSNSRGRGNKPSRTYGYGRGMKNIPYKPNPNQQSKDHKQTCYRCGRDGHWSRICSTSKHLVEAYQKLQKEKNGKTLQGESHHASLPEANMVFNIDTGDSHKIKLSDFGDNE